MASGLMASVIVCTVGKSPVFRQCIQAVLNQRTPPNSFEIIVVVNSVICGADRAWLVGRSHEVGPSLVVCCEPRPGLSWARNRGVREASAPLLVFLDDDAVAAGDWLQELLQCASQHGDAWVLGGRIELAWEASRPTWLHSDLLTYLGLLDLGADSRVLRPGERLGGGNFAVRADAFKTVDGFATCLGRDATSYLSGEEVELMKRVADLGGHAAYASNAVVWHRVPPTRTTRSFFRSRSYWQGRTSARMQRIARDSTRRRECGYSLVRLLWYLCRSATFRLEGRRAESALWRTYFWNRLGYVVERGCFRFGSSAGRFERQGAAPIAREQ